MTIDDQIKDEKQQYSINRKAAKLSALSSGEIRKYEYLTCENILPSNQEPLIEQAKFNYSPLGKAIEQQIKTIKEQGEKQIKANKSKGKLKQLKNILLMMKIVLGSQRKKKYLMNLQIKCLMK